MERSDSLIKLVSILVFAAVAVYIAFSLLGRSTELTTVEAVSIETRDSVTTTGYLVREEAPITGASDGVEMSAGDGAKVAAGEVVAIRYTSARSLERAERLQELELRIKQLNALMSGVTREELANESILELSSCVSSGKLDELYSIEQDINVYIIAGESLAAVDEEELSELEDERETLLKAAQLDTQYIRTDVPGVFSHTTDGFENVSPEMLEDIRPSDVEQLFSTAQSTSSNIGKLITDITWYYVTIVDEMDAAKLREGSTATVEFSRTYSAVLSMTVESVSPVEDGQCVIVFSCDRYMQDVAGLRDMTAEVVFERSSGIRVPREAVHVDEDGSTFVYILEGLRAKKVKITMQEEIGDSYMVSSGEGLRVRDQIIVQARNLYDGAVVAE